MTGLRTDVYGTGSILFSRVDRAPRAAVAALGALAWLGAATLSACDQAGTTTGTSYGTGATAATPTSGSAGTTVRTGGAGAAPAAGTKASSAGAGVAGGQSGAAAAASGAGGVSVAGAGGQTPAAGVGATAGGAAVAGNGAAGDAAGQAGSSVAGAGGAAGGAANATWKRGCKSGEAGPCASFIPNNGMEIEMGPYGAVMDRNVGKGFENKVASGDSDNNAQCRSFASIFGQDPKSTDMLLDTGDLDFALYTVYRPAQFNEGEKIPIITWGNGTCAVPEGYATLLRYVASHGFFIVAPNSRWVGSGAEMRKGIDFALAANDDPMSPYYQKLDASKIGAMGHSQGGQGTLATVSDSRVKAVIIWNMDISASKPFLAVSGDADLVGTSASGMRNAVNRATVKATFLYYHMVPDTGNYSGHLTLMTQPERVVEPATAWWKYILNDDAESKAALAGTSCKFCNHDDDYEFGSKNIE